MQNYNGSHVNQALDYANQVVSGEIPAGKYTQLACARQLRDLENGVDGCYFDEVEAERVCSFIELLPHTKGRWAAHKQLIKLEPWQCFIFATLFGWRRTKDDTRRFRKAYICVARKNGKSVIAAGIGLYMLAMDGEYGAEVYSGATTEKQAWEVFKPARIMAQRSPELIDAAGIDVMAKAISIPEQGAKFEPLIGNPGDGASPSCAIVDEYHEHDSSNLYDTMETGMGAREQPLMLVITTAGSSIHGPCHELQRDCEQILDGVSIDDEQFGVIYHADPEDDWTDPAILRKANPNFGVSVFEDFLLAKQRDAISSPAKQNIFRTKHMNQWVSAKTAWLNMLDWAKCGDNELQPDDYNGSDAFIAIDLASKIDIAAVIRLATVIQDGLRHYYVYPLYYLPEQTIEDDKSGRYQKWLTSGHLIATDGNEIDFRVIRADVAASLGQYNVIQTVYDPWRATQLAQELQDDGANCVEFRQTVQNMSPAMYELESAIKAGRLHHNNNPVTNWMASNVVAKRDAKDNIYPRKERPQNKIDGMVALIMAVGAAMESEEINLYENQSLRVL